MAQAFIPNPLNLPQADHIDGKKFNCCVSNLRWSTSADNVKAAFETGLNPSGEEHGRAKLTVEQALYVRENPDGLTAYELAEKHNCCEATVSRILHE